MLVNLVAILILSMPCVLGFNVLSGIQPFGEGSVIMDLEDFIVSNNILPLGSLVYLLFCVSRRGWGWESFLAEANTGSGLKFPRGVRFYVTYVLPLIVEVPRRFCWTGGALSCPPAAGRAGLLLHQDDVLSEPADPVPGDIAVLLPAQQAEQPPPPGQHQSPDLAALQIHFQVLHIAEAASVLYVHHFLPAQLSDPRPHSLIPLRIDMPPRGCPMTSGGPSIRGYNGI